jgi:hypothetical protein
MTARAEMPGGIPDLATVGDKIDMAAAGVPRYTVMTI